MANDQIDSEHADKGWQLMHAQDAVTADESGSGAAQPGHFIGLKRDANSAGDAPVELAAQSIDGLNEMIAEWERARPVPEGEEVEPTSEQVESSVKATAEQLVSSGARPIDVEAAVAAAAEETGKGNAEGAGKPAGKPAAKA